jgi:hypothetical protein
MSGVAQILVGSTALMNPIFWTPTNLLESLTLWLDADDAGTITLNGSNVRQWDDKSGNGRHASQTNSVEQPAYVTNSLNARAGVDWGSAINGYRLLNTSTFASPFVMGVGDYDGANPFDQFAGFYVGSTGPYRPIFTSNSGVNWLASAQCALNGAVTGSATALPTISSPFIVRNVSVTSTATHSTTTIGNDSGTTSVRGWRGKIYEVVTLAAEPSTEDRQKLEGYLAWKWGLTYALPADHPYKWDTRLFGGEDLSGFDTDAKAYIASVETADKQELEPLVRQSINDFVVGCKADGIWSAIKSSCILAGARTLAGALQPLVGTAPTNFNFVAGDYNRKTGLVGNGSTKYLDTNRAGNADPQNSKHVAVYTSLFGGQGGVLANRPSTGATYFDVTGGSLRLRVHVSAGSNDITTNTNVITGLVGGSRTGSSTGTIRYSGTNANITTTSETPQADTILAYARRNSSTGAAELFAPHRLAFYSIGEAVNLAQLDTRVTALMETLQFFLNTGLVASDYDADTVAYINRGYAVGGTLA